MAVCLPVLVSAQSVPLTWIPVGGSSGITISGDGTVNMVGPGEIAVRSEQTVSTDFFFEVTLPAGFGDNQHLPYIGLDPNPLTPTGKSLWGISSIGNKIRVDGQSQAYAASAGDRIAMEARAGVVRYYKNYSGPTSTPLYVSALPAIQPGVSFQITMLKPIGGPVGDQWVAVKVTLSE